MLHYHRFFSIQHDILMTTFPLTVKCNSKTRTQIMGNTGYSEKYLYSLTLKPNGGYIKNKENYFSTKGYVIIRYRLYDDIREQIPTYNLNLYNQGDIVVI